MLLYRDGDVNQALKGDAGVVRELFARIQRDARHHTVIRLLERDIAERSSGDWSMGFRTLERDDLERVPGFTPFLDRRFSEKPTIEPSLAGRLLESFRRGE